MRINREKKYFFVHILNITTEQINCLGGKAKYGYTLDNWNIRYLTKNLAIFELNLKL